MSELKDKVAHLKEMAGGLKVGESQEYGNLLNSIIEALDVLTGEVEKLDSQQVKMQEQVNTIDEDLGTLEEEVYDSEDYDGELIEITCPHCEEVISFTEDAISEEGEVECPDCHKTFEVEWECDCDDCSDCNDK